MWLSQRFSAINKQLRKPTKSQSTTLPRKRPTGIASISSPLQISSTLPRGLATPPESPSIPGSSPPLVLSASKTTIPTTPETNSSMPLHVQKKPLEIMVVGAFQVTKSAAIRLGFDDVRPVRSKYKGNENTRTYSIHLFILFYLSLLGGHTYQTKLLVDRTLYPLDLVKLDDTNVIDSSRLPCKVHDVSDYEKRSQKGETRGGCGISILTIFFFSCNDDDDDD